MATTTNFGWETPDDTDLVKDGALAIRTLGSAIDTSLVDLKGGTTGQVLSKTSNTDMDFTWVTSDDANAIQNAIVDAKGDLIAASAADTPARLAVGNNGETLVADSSATTGLRWQGSMAAGKNVIINGGFDIWQRGTSFSVGNGWIYTADRWQSTEGAGTWTLSRESSVVPSGSQYALKLTSGGTTTGQIATLIETANVTALAGKTVVLSAQVAASTSIPMQFLVYYSTSTDDNISNTSTAISATSGGTATPTSTTYVTMSGVYSIPSNAKTLQIRIASQNNMTSTQAFYVGQVQLELGSVATTFTRSGGTLAGELAACQRYYWRNQPGGTYSPYGNGMATSTTVSYSYIPFPVDMRTTPTVVDFANIGFGDLQNGVAGTGGIATVYNGTKGIFLQVNGTYTQYRPGNVMNNNNTGGYLGFGAEL